MEDNMIIPNKKSSKKKSISDFTANDYMQMFNFISRILHHCIEEEDITVNRWEVTEYREDIKKNLLNDRNIDIKYAFRPGATYTNVGFTLYVIFSENKAFVKYQKAIFSDEKPVFIINFPFFMISNEKIEDGEEKAFRNLSVVFNSIFFKTMELEMEDVLHLGDYHSRLLFVRNDKSECDCVNKALTDLSVLTDSYSYPIITNKEIYTRIISQILNDK